jgi:hypothetical protein
MPLERVGSSKPWGWPGNGVFFGLSFGCGYLVENNKKSSNK